MNQRARIITTTFLSLILVCYSTGCNTSGAVTKADKPHIVIDWGQSTPDTLYLQRNTKACETLPVDGVATWPCWPRSRSGRLALKPIEKQYDAEGRELPVWVTPSGQQVGDYTLGRRVIDHDRITPEMYAGAINDLRKSRFNRFKYMLINVLLANNNRAMNWFDDGHWEIVCHNIAAIAKLAKKGGCRGIFVDPETYGYPMWKFTDLAGSAGLPGIYGDKSWDQVHAAVKHRGAQFMRAIESEYPHPTVWFALAYGFGVGQSDGDPAKLPNASYALLPAFLDGMLEASTAGTILVDGNETSYHHKTAKQFRRTRKACLEDALRITTVPADLYRSRVRCGFGLWIDNGRQWDPGSPQTNPFTPDEFEESIRLALEIGDGYVWLWSEIANWYGSSPDWKPADDAPIQTRVKYVPDSYRDALSNGRARAMSRRSSGTVSCEAAKAKRQR